MHLISFVTLFGCVCVAKYVPLILRESRSDITPRAPTSEEVHRDLGPLLSDDAIILLPSSPDFSNATSRWNIYGGPGIAIVVEPATVEDVALTVLYANHIQKPFIAVNKGHGSAETLISIQDGIEIWMDQFKQVEIAEDGQSARLGGGLDVQEIIDELDIHDKAAGSCGCVGFLGAGLGGGHGRMQGIFGLIADNILEANVVLANANQTTVSETSHSDLLWGLRGAGHNFGIVTDAKYKVHDKPADSWFFANLQYNSSMLEQVVDLIQSQSDGGIPPELAVRHTQFRWVPDVDPSHPLVILAFAYAGTPEAAYPYLNPFFTLGPMTQNVTQSVQYPQISSLDGLDRNGFVCSHGRQNMQFSSYAERLNSTIVRQVYDLFEEATIALPEIKLGSVVIFERYSSQAVQAVPENFTAFAHRKYDYLFTAILSYESGTTSNGDVISWGEQIRSAFREVYGEQLGVYVNYAFGNESLRSIYGEEWRLEKLRALKHRYDPENRFGGYMPIN